MTDMLDKSERPELGELCRYADEPLFERLCGDIKERYGCGERIEFSSCSMKPGWNVKFKKSGRTLCTVYPAKHSVSVMIIVGRKEKDAVEAILPECGRRLVGIYRGTRELNGQRWLMIEPLSGDVYDDILRLIRIRAGR